MNFNLSSADDGMSSRLYLIPAKTCPANLFILTLKLSFDDIQIGPRKFLPSTDEYTRKVHTKEHFRGLHKNAHSHNLQSFYGSKYRNCQVKWKSIKKSPRLFLLLLSLALFILVEKQFNKMIEFKGWEGGDKRRIIHFIDRLSHRTEFLPPLSTLQHDYPINISRRTLLKF